MNIARALPATLAVAALGLAGAVGTAGAAGPVAHAAKSCKPGSYPGDGYFTSLKVRHIGCAGGRKVMRAHYKCRTRHGIKGRCGHVRHYRCTEKRAAISTEYNARVSCRRGSRRVVYTYQQNT
jgi:hypothetical protein